MALDDVPVKITLVTGYLGAGKTTLLNQLLSNDRNARIAVIVNDIGEVNIDAELIASGGLSESDSVVPLTNGCICCTLADDLAEQLGGLASSGNFDYIVIEASGICEPMPIAYTISEFCASGTAGSDALSLDGIVAVVDCARMVDEFQGGRSLVSKELEEDDVESLLIGQLEFCTTVVLNKTDLVTPTQVNEVRAIVRSLQKDAEILEAVEGKVPIKELLDTGRFDFDAVYRSVPWLEMLANPHDHDHDHGASNEHDHHRDDAHDHGCDHDEAHSHAHGHSHVHAHTHAQESAEELEYGISSFVYERRQPLSVDAFAAFLQRWPDSVIRTKGFVWVDQYPDTCFLFEQAGRQKKFIESGPFVITLPDDERERQLAQNPGLASRWDPVLGDRLIRLVFIGRNMDRTAIEADLDNCLIEWKDAR